MLIVFLISCLQGISFSLISRSRNRNNITYQVLASLIGNFLWYMTMRYLVLSEMSFEAGLYRDWDNIRWVNWCEVFNAY